LAEDYPGKFDTPSPKDFTNLFKGNLVCKCHTLLHGETKEIRCIWCSRYCRRMFYVSIFLYIHFREDESLVRFSMLKVD